jgi:hypothetical protein
VTTRSEQACLPGSRCCDSSCWCALAEPWWRKQQLWGRCTAPHRVLLTSTICTIPCCCYGSLEPQVLASQVADRAAKEQHEKQEELEYAAQEQVRAVAAAAAAAAVLAACGSHCSGSVRHTGLAGSRSAPYLTAAVSVFLGRSRHQLQCKAGVVSHMRL